MSTKFLIGIAAAFFAVFVVGIGAVVGITHVSDRTTISDVNSTPADAAHDTAAGFTPSAPKVLTPGVTQASTTTPASLPPTGQLVTDSDINQLASAVKLGAQNTGDVGKEIWARETPVAEHLLAGMCDCEQRNWLNHFVKTGKQAVEGSEDYYQSVQLLATLRRSNNELTQSQPHP